MALTAYLTDPLSNSPSAAITFILGGAGSGKSAFAEQLAAASAQPIYLATAAALDAEMQQRIAAHQQRRSSKWQTIEEPLELATAIGIHTCTDAIVLVDCLTLWLSNLLTAGRDVGAATEALVTALQEAAGPVILVSNEIGLGIVPEHKLAREFRDHSGRLHQAIAAVAQQVYFIVAGLPVTVKDQRSSSTLIR